jgi:hypothetical protein
VVVDDGSIAGAGWPAEDKFEGNSAKVPLLGDIPVLGNLFRSETRKRAKTNLMVFLRPVVLRDARRQQPPLAGPLRLHAQPSSRCWWAQAAARRSTLRLINEAPILPPTQLDTPVPPAATSAMRRLPFRAEAGRPAASRPLASKRPLKAMARHPTHRGGLRRRRVERRTVVGEVESDVDLSRMMQELPAVEDLLEASNDAPDHPHAQRAAHAGRARRRQRHPHRALRALLAVRFRVDGTLREVVQPNRALHAALISRLKIMAELDIAEKRCRRTAASRCASAAARSTCASRPCRRARRARGAAPARQEREAASSRSKALGMSGDAATASSIADRQPHGIVLVTGPTGSGKTTTLYAALSGSTRRPPTS